jgi:TrmH family RNA methyltransferase
VDLKPLSARNARVVRLGKLSRQRRERASAGVFVLDGPTLLDEALDTGVVVDEVFVDPNAVDRRDVTAVVERAVHAGASAWTVTGGLKGLVEPTTPNALAAVARIPSVDRHAETSSTAKLHLVLVDVSDPGNVGTLLRTAEAVGVDSVAVVGTSVDVWAPKIVRSSAGSVLRVPIRTGPANVVLEELGAADLRRVGCRADEDQTVFDVDLTGPTALVLGSEAHGLPPHVDAMIDEWVSLPMQGSVDSLNVAVAGSVLLYEATRQRTPPRDPTDL